LGVAIAAVYHFVIRLRFAGWEARANPPHQLDGIADRNLPRQPPPATHARIVEMFSRLVRGIVENETTISTRLRRIAILVSGGVGFG
jgi:hypothetical protein